MSSKIKNWFRQMAQRILIPDTHSLITDPRWRKAGYLFHCLNNRKDPNTGKIWKPNDMQRQVGEYFFVHGKRRGMAVCGRKSGKSEISVDLMWRFGNLINKGQIYYFAKEQTAAREIIWESNRLKDWGPQDYVADANENEMRVTFTSGTFAKCDGADRFASKKGFNPDVVILDEAADYPDAFWHTMLPNFAAKDCIVLIITSPPWEQELEPGKPTLFMRMVELYKKEPRYFYINVTSFVNEMNLPEGFLQQEEKDLTEMGQKDIWEREYLAKFIITGGASIIPTFDKTRHVVPHEQVLARIKDREKDFEFVTSLDPGSVYGAVFQALNLYTKEAYWLDELYVREQADQMVEIFWPDVLKKQQELFPNQEWLTVYDEAAKWFYIEATNRFEAELVPTEKARNDKMDGISLLRTIFAYGKGLMSDRCKWTAWEFENYRRDDKGNIPKKNDHNIDNSRYNLHAVNYHIGREDKPAEPLVHEAFKKEPSLEEDIADYLNEQATGDILDYFYNGGIERDV